MRLENRSLPSGLPPLPPRFRWEVRSEWSSYVQREVYELAARDSKFGGLIGGYCVDEILKNVAAWVRS
jgi:hypothetical protein